MNGESSKSTWFGPTFFTAVLIAVGAVFWLVLF